MYHCMVHYRPCLIFQSRFQWLFFEWIPNPMGTHQPWVSSGRSVLLPLCNPHPRLRSGLLPRDAPPTLRNTKPAPGPAFRLSVALTLHHQITTFYLLSLRRQRLPRQASPLSSGLPTLTHPRPLLDLPYTIEMNKIILPRTGSFLYQVSNLWWGNPEISTKHRRLHEEALWDERMWTHSTHNLQTLF